MIVVICLCVSFWAWRGRIVDLKAIRTFRLEWLVLYFGVHVIWLLNSANLKQGFSDVERHLSFLILPLALPAMLREMGQRKTFSGYKMYVLGTFLVCVTALVLAFLTEHKSGFGLASTSLLNHNLVEFLNLHATYFSLNVLLASILIFYLAVFREDSVRSERVLCLIAIPVFVFVLYLLRARIVLIGAIIVTPLLAFWFSNKRAKYLLITIAIFAVTAFAAATAVDGTFRARFLQISRVDFNNLMGTNAENGVTQRIFLWQRAVESIRKSPWVGHGTGDMYEELRTAIANYLHTQNLTDVEQDAIQPFLSVPYNPHNQMLVDVIKFGVIGCVVLLGMFVNGFLTSFKEGNFLLFALLGFFAISCLTEAMLVRQKGVDLFCVFYIIFSYCGSKQSGHAN